jgi:hypothetical protein
MAKQSMAQTKAKSAMAISIKGSTIQRIVAIRERTEAASNAEVVRNAIRVYGRLLSAQADGQQVLLREPSGETTFFPVGL